MNTLRVKVSRTRQEAAGIQSYFLVSEDGRQLPGFTPGSHIDVHIPGGPVRQYSLCNAASDHDGYLIAVQRDPSSRGGSIAMHEQVAVGSVLEISAPRNHFPLVEAQHSLLIAGGIGITPIIAMAEQLAQGGANFELHYCARSEAHAAFLNRIRRSGYGDRAHLHFSDGLPSTRLNLDALFDSTPYGTHVYVCGPAALTEAVLAIAVSRGWNQEALHREYFANIQPQDTSDSAKEFNVKLASTGKTFCIPAGKSVYEVLSVNGIEIPVSCESGVCGTCLTRVLEGTPDHRDVFLTEQERAQNDQFTPCCSRAHSNLLVLDL